MADHEDETPMDEQASSSQVSPPVLDVSSTSASGGAEASSSAEGARREVPPTIPGLSAMLSEWQISGLPDYQHFFSTEDKILDAAVTAIKARLDENDSNVRRAWLLTEIDHWDLEKERVVVLTDNNLISVKYNFIQQQVEELKFIPLAYIRELRVGEFKYTHSYAHTRKGKGLKIIWGEEPISFWTRWNPASSVVPYTIFASHILVMQDKMRDPNMTLDTVISPLDQAIQEFREKTQAMESPPSLPEYKMTEENLIVDYYLGVSALVHNQSYLGFYKKRGALNW